MLIDTKTKLVLAEKLRFSANALQRLEQDSEMLGKLKRLIQAAQSPNQPVEVKRYATDQIKKIRAKLSSPFFSRNQVLADERRAYYSFFS